MTVESVRGTFQGAAYPFSYDQPPDGPPFLGPIVCAVGPDGDLFVGGVRDSGWGGANNIGEVVRLRIADRDPSKLPNGIREVRISPTGFTIELIAPVDAKRAEDLANYHVDSYTRVSTPAYGGEDVNRRTERISAIHVSRDGRVVNLDLAELRTGYVYELHLKNMTTDSEPFFPSEAHYTVRSVP
jgi:hypothetical protein